MRLNIQLFASGAIEFDNWTSGSTIRGKIEWSSEVDGSTASERSNRNRSKVTTNMYVRRSSGGEPTRGREWSGYLDTGGDRYDFYETQDGSSISVGTSWVYVDRYITYVNHNADGTKNVYLSGGITGPSGTTLDGKSSWGGATVTLDTIPRMSPITSVTSGTTNYAPAVKWTPYSSEFKYKVEYSYGNWSSGQSALISPGSTSEQTYSGITINGDDVAPYMTDRETATFTATLYTYASDGTTLIGSTTKTFEVTLNASYVPTASIGAITDAGGLVPSSWGILVAGKSKLAFAVTGTPSLGSTISDYTSIVEGRTYTGSNVTTNFVTESGIVNSYVTDSRGRISDTVIRNYTVYPYSSPVITTAVAERCLQDGTLSDQGTYVKYSFSAAVSSCDGHNTGTYQLGYRVHDTGNYTYMTITNGATDVIIPGVQFNAQTSYDIQFLASDTFTTTPVVITLIVYEGFRLVHYNKNHKALAVGKMSTATGNNKLFEIALPTNITDEVNSTADINTTADISANDYSGNWEGYTNDLSTTMSNPSEMLVVDGTTIKKATVPSSSGGIEDSGSNSNGYYIKFTDGTMICWKSVSPTTNITNSWGSMYESTSAASFGNWAQAFYYTPIISVTKTSGQGCWLELVQNVSKTSCGSTYFVSAVSRSNVTPTVNIVGYGRWKA